MLRFSRTYLLIFLWPCSLVGQNCDLKITGRLVDEITGRPMSYATIYVEELKTGTAADSLGKLELSDLCPGNYHLRFNHIGCETKSLFVELRSDTLLEIEMHHHNELVDEVVVHDHSSEHEVVSSTTIRSTEIAEISNRDLSEILEDVTGVSSLKSGAGISKPVLHGMYGNRLTILNNGIAQAGQQWGNDHAPEVDAFAAGHISVVKGAGALAYPGSSAGGVVLIEPDPIKKDPHLHGKVGYIFQSNGLGHTLNAQLAQYAKWAAWRVSGTAKLIGDRAAPKYYLTNTGKREYNVAAQLEKRFSPKWKADLYYSLFTTEIGILRGSHIGNLTDLEDALTRTEPLFTEDRFSYKIQAPKQKVMHHLAKLEVAYIVNDRNSLKLRYAFQLNDREEFDVRRSGRTELPALSLAQIDHFLEIQHQFFTESEVGLRSGIQLRMIDNTNNPETGILPLIPDYRSYDASAFIIASKEWQKWSSEIGGRYDLRSLEALTISNSIPREIIRYDHLFHNYSASAGVKFNAAKFLKLNLNVGHLLRAPAINEMYSNGLHQGVAGIEEGDRSLSSEQSTKAVLTADWRFGDKLFVQTLGYFQYIQNYVYLQPQDSFRLTIRGAFPVFRYEQTDATLFGADVLLSYEPIESIRLQFKYAFLRGNDLTNRQPLIYMPPNNLSASATYILPDGKKFKNTQFGLNGRYVFKQGHLNDDQDLLPVPDGYFLLGASVGTTLHTEKLEFQFSLRGQNLLNSIYRDYLNRQRYFADELGWNLNLRMGVVF